MSESQETHAFQAEVGRVLDLVINSLYSHREIFLRELVSNASDALDKLRFGRLTDRDLGSGDVPLEIKISADREAGTLTIADSGLGMSHDDLIEHLGTVARSGTQAFAQALSDAGEAADEGLIGQFGVGFYSSFLVADEVEVISRSASSDEAWSWRSNARESFTMEPAEREAHGTTVILHLGEEHQEFLDEWRIEQLVTRYSDYVHHPIMVQVSREIDPEVEGEEPILQKVFEKMNTGAALWQRSKDDIEDEEYDEFYRHISRSPDAPVSRTHFQVEGAQLFTGLLYLPKHAPFDLFMKDSRHGVRLYVKRVFIMEDCDELLPRWLRFVRGVVDSDDLPLNVSRELLQDSRAVRVIEKQLTRKSLDMIEALAKDDAEAYAAFWEAFGAVLKEGLHLSYEHKERLSKLLRFHSSAEPQGWVSLEQYVERMPEGQEDIYVVLGQSVDAVAASPHLEGLKKKGYEILYLTDPIDEWVLSSLGTYEDKTLVSAMKADLSFDDAVESDAEGEGDAAETNPQEEAFSALLSRFGSVLEEEVSEVRLSKRLTESPACLVVAEGGMHAHVERMLRASDPSLQIPSAKRILELNADHPVITGLQGLVDNDSEAETIDGWIQLVHDQSLLAEGSPISDPARFAGQVSRLMAQAMK
ncbi:MAG: molecular chaperone HtpG [Myxococcota bacterium]|nr:molecular chaperone HtpG [Myxococcota bacterium]